MTATELKRLMHGRFEIEGCHLIDHVSAEQLIGDHYVTYHSELRGHGPHAWDDHWLFVALWSRSGEVIGVIWVDDPSDRLLPSARKLQALRVFANQATTALDAASQYEEMQFLAEHDPLTRLLNRRAFDAQLDAEVARAVRYNHSLGLLLCDLNGFKRLNDDHGHAAGDTALERVGAALQATIRTVDSAYRIGGDEFAVLLPQTDRTEAARGDRADLGGAARRSGHRQRDRDLRICGISRGRRRPAPAGTHGRCGHVRGQTRSRIGSHRNRPLREEPPRWIWISPTSSARSKRPCASLSTAG